MPVVMKTILIVVCVFISHEQLHQEMGHKWNSLVQAFTIKMFHIQNVIYCILSLVNEKNTVYSYKGGYLGGWKAVLTEGKGDQKGTNFQLQHK